MTSHMLMPRIAALGLAGLLAACAAPPSLYRWNDYPAQVYSYLRNDGSSHEAQIQILEKGLAQTAATNAALPPGYLAHLGLLYLNTGRTADALEAWEREKASYPESAQFIDYLTGNLKKNRN